MLDWLQTESQIHESFEFYPLFQIKTHRERDWLKALLIFWSYFCRLNQVKSGEAYLS